MKKSVLLTALSVGLLSANLALATPQQASNQIKDNAVQVLQILKKSNGNNDAAVRKQAEDYASPYFDFDMMTRVSVGAPWKQASAAQQQMLVQEFRKMLIRTYASQMLRYKNAQVDVKSGVAKDAKDGNTYKVYNVVFEGVFNLVQSQKQQFKPILDAKGVEGLIAQLKAKNGSK